MLRAWDPGAVVSLMLECEGVDDIEELDGVRRYTTQMGRIRFQTAEGRDVARSGSLSRKG